MAVLHTIANEWRFLEQKNDGKQSFNAPFSASDFASQSRTNEKPPVVRCGNPKRMQNRQGFHCGNSKRMQNRRASSPCPPRHPSRTFPTNEWRKFIRFRNEWRKLARFSADSLPQTYADPPFVLKRKKTAGHSDRQDGGTHGDPPIIRSERQDECTRIRQSFSNERKTAGRREARRLPAADSRRPTLDRPRETHGAALAIAKRTNTCQPLAIGQSAGCIAAARHRSKWRAAA